MIKNKDTIVEVYSKEVTLILTTFIQETSIISYDVNALLKINISSENTTEKEYFANLARALVKTLKKYCSEKTFKSSSVFYKECNFEIVLITEFKNKNLYGLLFKILSEKLKITANCFTGEIQLRSNGEINTDLLELKHNEENCILISYIKENGRCTKIYFLEKSRGNISKDYLIDYIKSI